MEKKADEPFNREPQTGNALPEQGFEEAFQPCKVFCNLDQLETVLEFDCESVESVFPISDGHRPFLRCSHDRRVDNLQSRITMREDLSVSNRLADDAVERFDRVGCVDHFSNLIGVVKNGDEMFPMA